MENKWIKCSDKMPPNDEDVLAVLHILYPTVHIVVRVDGRFYNARDDEHVTQWVKYWMPLPELPEVFNE